ncbi:MAG: calcium-binding protein [Sulfitobacter sp.]
MPLQLINTGAATVNLVTSDDYLQVSTSVLAVSGSDAIIGSSISSVNLNLDGYVASSINAIDITGAAVGALTTIMIGNNGYIFGGSNAIRLVTGNYVVENHGIVTGANGINMSSVTSSQLINYGSITATASSATGAEISTGGQRSVNYGSITGFEAVDIFNTSGGGTVEFDNFGSLISTGFDAINGDSGDADIIRNYGTISGNVNLEGGDNSFANYGSVSGDVLNEDGNDRVVNGGEIDGDVFLAGGADVYVGQGDGFVSGTIDLGTGDDVAVMGDAGGVLLGGTGDDVIRGGEGADQIAGGADNDNIRGRQGDDILNGDAGNDVIRAGQGDDILDGGSGNDFMRGGAGDDVIIGGLGQDTMFGNAGADVFDFNSAGESPNAGVSWDRIMDFTQGEDLIDLSQFNARFIGTGAYAANGNIAEVRIFEDPNGDTRVFVDVNADGTSDMRFYLVNTLGITADDFIL